MASSNALSDMGLYAQNISDHICFVHSQMRFDWLMRSGYTALLPGLNWELLNPIVNMIHINRISWEGNTLCFRGSVVVHIVKLEVS